MRSFLGGDCLQADCRLGSCQQQGLAARTQKNRAVFTARQKLRGLLRSARVDSAQTQLAQDSLTGEELGAKSDHETEHGETPIPGFSKSDKTETGSGFSHGCSLVTKLDVIVTDLEAEVALDRSRP